MSESLQELESLSTVSGDLAKEQSRRRESETEVSTLRARYCTVLYCTVLDWTVMYLYCTYVL